MSDSLLTNREQRLSGLYNKLSEKLSTLEDLRLDYIKRRNRFNLYFFAVVALLVGLFLWKDVLFDISIWFVFGGILLYVLISAFYLGKYKSAVTNMYERDVVPTMIDEFFPEATYRQGSCLSETDYWNSGLFNRSVDRYNGHSLFKGIFGETKIRFSQLHTEYKTTRHTKNGTRTTWHTIFKGILMVADANKRFNGRTYVTQDVAERTLGGFGKWLQEKTSAKGTELVYLENPAFEKEYAVYSSDPVEARYLLTPSMQEYLVNLHKHNGGGVIISFVDGNVYLAMTGGFNLFGAKMNLSFTDRSTIEYYMRDLLHILSTIEILDLNTRIWKK
jgi:Protein of unknown function (DUF3137).